MPTLGSFLAGPTAQSATASALMPQQPAGTGVQGGAPEDKKNAWRAFLDKLADDDNFRTGVLDFGTNLLQPRQGGQSQAGAIGGAIRSGVNTTQQLNQQDAASARADRELGQRDRQLNIQQQTADAQTSYTGAQTDRTIAETGRLEQMTPVELEALRARTNQVNQLAQAAGMQANLTEAQIDSIDAQRGPETERIKAQTAELLARAEQLAQTPGQARSGEHQLALQLSQGWLEDGIFKPGEKNKAFQAALEWMNALKTTQNPEQLRAKLNESLAAYAPLAQPEELVNANNWIDAVVEQHAGSLRRLDPRGVAGAMQSSPFATATGGSGTQDAPLRPQSVEEFQAIPIGAWYINPRDGQPYQKTP